MTIRGTLRNLRVMRKSLGYNVTCFLLLVSGFLLRMQDKGFKIKTFYVYSDLSTPPYSWDTRSK